MVDSMDTTGTVHTELENGCANSMNEISTELNDEKPMLPEAPMKSGLSTNPPSKQPQKASELQPQPQLSKNALKRLRRQQAWEEQKKERKLRDKLKKKQKKEEERRAREEELRAKAGQKRKAGSEEGDAVKAEDLENEAIVKKQKKAPTLVPITIILDCGFDDLMHEKVRDYILPSSSLKLPQYLSMLT